MLGVDVFLWDSCRRNMRLTDSLQQNKYATSLIRDKDEDEGGGFLENCPMNVLEQIVLMLRCLD